MQADPKSVSSQMTLADLDRWLLDEKVWGAPVVDDDGRVVGVVSRSDIARQVAVGLTHAEIIEDFYGEYTIRGPSNEAAGEFEQATVRLRDIRVKDAMSDRIVSVSPETPIEETARTMLENGVHRLLVQDGSGKLLGVVSALDYVKLAAD